MVCNGHQIGYERLFFFPFTLHALQTFAYGEEDGKRYRLPGGLGQAAGKPICFRHFDAERHGT
jgi:hypothetical protein